MPFLLLSWEVNLSVVLAWIDHRSCHDGFADEYLCLDRLLLKGFLIIVELKIEWSIIRPFSFLLQVNGVKLL